MITGKVNKALDPIVSLTIIGNGTEVTVDAVIDTVFSGELTLPLDLIKSLTLLWRSRGISILGDGSESVFDLYFGAVIWNNKIHKVVIDSVETMPLIGMRLLRNSTLWIEVCEGGDVRIESMLP